MLSDATLFQTDLRITNHKGHKYPLPVTLNPFIQNANQMAFRLTTTASFPNVFFQLQQFSQERPSFSAHRTALMAKTALTSPVFSSKFVDFAVQFCFRCKFSFHWREATLESRLTVAWFSWTNHNSLLRIATNEIAAFCIDNSLRQMAFFRVRQNGRRPAFDLWRKILNWKKLYL